MAGRKSGSRDVWLTAADVADEIGIGYSTLGLMRQRGEGPAFYRVGGVVRYRREDVDAWLASCRVEAQG